MTDDDTGERARDDVNPHLRRRQWRGVRRGTSHRFGDARLRAYLKAEDEDSSFRRSWDDVAGDDAGR